MNVLRVTFLWCYGPFLRQFFGILLRHWHMLETHIRCMVEAYTWYMILFVWYFVETLHWWYIMVHSVCNNWDILWVLWYMVEAHGLRSILDIGHIIWDTFLVYVWGIPWWHWCMVRYIVDAWYGVGTCSSSCMIWYRFGTWLTHISCNGILVILVHAW